MELLKKSGLKNGAVVIFFLTALFAGGYQDYVAALTGAALLIYIAVIGYKNRKLSFNVNLTSLSVVVISLFYLVSVLWAVDKGMAFVGFVKFLPVPAFMLILMQENTGSDRFIKLLVPFGFAVTLISIPLMFVPYLEGYFSVADRLAGPFQYPNVMALFMLLCELLVVFKKKYRWLDFFFIAVFIIGIYLTGSRSVFAIGIAANIAAIFMKRNKKVTLITACTLLVVAVTVICLAVFTDIPLFDRLVRFSFFESTFAGRLLYFRDAVVMILKRPFGMGYMGYYYMQQSVQTGVYSVNSVHNGILQFMLDVGIIPALLFLAAVIKGLFSKNIKSEYKLLIATVFLHLCFDFDLQFAFIFMTFLLFFNLNEGKKINVNLSLASVILSLLSLYMGVALSLCGVGLYKTGLSLYPANTKALTNLLLACDDINEQYEIGNEILKYNEYVTVAYSARARYFYSKGDFASVIENKNEIFKKTQFACDEYKEYCYMLINGISMYSEKSDSYSARICVNELIMAYEELSNMNDKLSYFGKIIKDKPDTALEPEVSEYIEKLKQ
ncbi:MAG: O-antigen ligase family protein [Acutalibacteraceae bacterium]|nr:O-antigen ligase family protein [Acutalibacteraceae bacterium]